MPLRVPLPSVGGLPGVGSLLPRIEAALDAVVRLERTLRSLPEDIRLLQLELASVGAIHGEVHALRRDVERMTAAVSSLLNQFERLPPEVERLRESMDQMFTTVNAIDGRVASMGSALDGVERLAGRLAHPLRPRRQNSRIEGDSSSRGG